MITVAFPLPRLRRLGRTGGFPTESLRERQVDVNARPAARTPARLRERQVDAKTAGA